MNEKFIKRYIRIKKSLNEKIDIIQKEMNENYSYVTLSYLLELGILKHEEIKLQNDYDNLIDNKLDKIISMLEDLSDGKS